MNALPSISDLQRRCDELDGVELLMVLAGPGGVIHGRTALVSSFGAESGVLLHLVASVDPYIPVIFLDTLKHFPETLEYRDQLVERLGLREVRTLRPDRLNLSQNDRHERLFLDDPDLCCHIRKTEPLDVALRGFAAWITGRKRFQGGSRTRLDTIELDPATGRLKLNPLANWSEERLQAYRREHGIPLHPLVTQGYRSIGCAPCTRPSRMGEDTRSGRWVGMDKIECGIHRPVAHAAVEVEGAEFGAGLPHLAAAADRIPLSRLDALAALLERLGPSSTTPEPWGRLVETVVPQPDLRAALTADASLAALLPGFRGTLQWDAAARGVSVGRDAVVGLLPALRRDLPALAAAARLGLELAELYGVPSSARARRMAAVLAYARGLPAIDDPALTAVLPATIVAALAKQPARVVPDRQAAEALVALLVDRGMPAVPAAPAPIDPLDVPLATPLELVLAEAGDARLQVDPVRGLNRYGTAPRPRPEAIHFSSSTASSVSDYGFLLSDEIRRRLLRRSAEAVGPVWSQLADRVRKEIAGFLGLAAGEADVVLAASGTDTELLAVLLALAAAPNRRTLNILIAPEETGRGVVLAGEGRYFDDTTATGVAVTKGAAVWPDRDIGICCLPVRDVRGRVRSTEAIVADLRDEVGAALARGDRVLAHVLLSSKTGISAPPLEVVDALRRGHEDEVDVVVDACQLRVTPSLLGALVRRGWMVQITGSKFLTGPAFSGALIVPAAMRARREAASRLLADAPGVGGDEDWPADWRMADGRATAAPRSYGVLFRWIAALGEATLVSALPRSLCRHAFQRFRSELHERLEASPVLVPMPTPDRHLTDLGEEAAGLAARSIICFSPTVELASGGRRRASLEECQLLFEYLNNDASGLIALADPGEQALARRAMHIGQPVALRGDSAEAPVVLRLVVGARFFTIVGFPVDGDVEAALRGEIHDAIAAIDKLELLVKHLPELAAAKGPPAPPARSASEALEHAA